MKKAMYTASEAAAAIGISRRTWYRAVKLLNSRLPEEERDCPVCGRAMGYIYSYKRRGVKGKRFYKHDDVMRVLSLYYYRSDLYRYQLAAERAKDITDLGRKV